MSAQLNSHHALPVREWGSGAVWNQWQRVESSVEPFESAGLHVMTNDTTIEKLSGKYAYMDNFYWAPFRYRRLWYPTAEHAFQSQKATNFTDAVYVADTDDPGEAKHRGNEITLRSDWEDVKDKIMYEIVREKFTQWEGLRDNLLATGERMIIEGNFWGDRYWGMEWEGKGWVGRNQLGETLMRVRRELRDGRHRE